MSKLGDKLNFNVMKNSASETRSLSQSIPCRSGVTFQPQQVVEWELAGNRPYEFIDVNNNLKIKLPVTCDTAGDTLDRAGAYSFVNKWEFIQNGVVISSLPKANVLITALSDFQMSKEYKTSAGRLLEGMDGDYLRGEIMTTNERIFYLSPLGCDLAMTTPHRMLYLGSGGPITIRLTLESSAVALVGTGSYTVNRPELLIQSTFLPKDTMDQLSQFVKSYSMLCNSYDHMSAVIPAGTTSSHIKLSFAKASLERILFTVRPTSHTTGAGKFSLGSRCTGNMSTYQLQIAGEDYPKTAIKVEGSGADSLYHVLQADNIASNYGHGVQGLMNSYQNNASGQVAGPQNEKANPYMIIGDAADGSTAGKSVDATAGASSNIGTFVGAVNLESALVTSQNSPLYSGVNTKNGIDLYWKASFSGAGVIAGGVTIDFYALSTELVHLDTDTNLWVKKN